MENYIYENEILENPEEQIFDEEEPEQYEFYEPEEQMVKSYNDSYAPMQQEMKKDESQIYKIVKNFSQSLKLDVDNNVLRTIAFDLVKIINANKTAMSGLTSEEIQALVAAMLFVFINRTANYPNIERSGCPGDISDKEVFYCLLQKSGININKSNFLKALELIIFQSGFVPMPMANRKRSRSISMRPVESISVPVQRKIKYIQLKKVENDRTKRIPTKSSAMYEQLNEHQRRYLTNKIKNMLKSKVANDPNRRIHEFVIDNIDKSDDQLSKELGKLSIGDRRKAEVALEAAFKKLKL